MPLRYIFKAVLCTSVSEADHNADAFALFDFVGIPFGFRIHNILPATRFTSMTIHCHNIKFKSSHFKLFRITHSPTPKSVPLSKTFKHNTDRNWIGFVCCFHGAIRCCLDRLSHESFFTYPLMYVEISSARLPTLPKLRLTALLKARSTKLLVNNI